MWSGHSPSHACLLMVPCRNETACCVRLQLYWFDVCMQVSEQWPATTGGAYDYADVLHKSFIFYFQQRSGKLPYQVCAHCSWIQEACAAVCAATACAECGACTHEVAA